MILMLKLAIIALIISVVVWSVFGYFIAEYLMARPAASKKDVRDVSWSHYPTPLVFQNVAAAAVVFALPQPTIMIPAENLPHDICQLPNDISGNNATSAMIYVTQL